MTNGAARCRRHTTWPRTSTDCFDPARPACQTGRLVFHDECISDRKERYGGRTFDTLANQIAANGDAGKRLIVKIDVEGAEWDALMATPESILEQIDQLPMELHGVNEERFIATVRKLKEQFHLVNLNVNNMVLRSRLGAVSRVGIPGAVREQADRRRRSVSARARAGEPAQRARRPHAAGVRQIVLKRRFLCAEALLCSESSGCLGTDLLLTDRTEKPLMWLIVPTAPMAI